MDARHCGSIDGKEKAGLQTWSSSTILGKGNGLTGWNYVSSDCELRTRSFEPTGCLLNRRNPIV